LSLKSRNVPEKQASSLCLKQKKDKFLSAPTIFEKLKCPAA